MTRARTALKLAVACLLAAACGDNARNVVQVDLSLGTPDLIVYREDSGPWERPTWVAEGSYTFEVVDDFEVVAVHMIDTDSFYAQQLAGTYGEASRWLMVSTSEFGALAFGRTVPASVFRNPCQQFPRDSTVVVSGRMAQAGQVAMDSSCETSTSAPWTFTLDVIPGTHDLIATGPVAGVPRVAIERGHAIAAATILPDVDLAMGGTPLETTPLVILDADKSSGVPTASAKITLRTLNGAADVSSTAGALSSMQSIEVSTVPTSVMETVDSQFLEVHSPGGELAPIDRSARALFTGTETLLELIPPPSVSFSIVEGVDAASWDARLAERYGYVDLNVDADTMLGTGHSTQRVTMTRRWLEHHSAASIAFDTKVPGYRPSWTIDRTHSYTRVFSVRGDSTNVTYMTRQTSRIQAP